MAALATLMQALEHHNDNEITVRVGEAASAPMACLRGIARELAGLA